MEQPDLRSFTCERSRLYQHIRGNLVALSKLKKDKIENQFHFFLLAFTFNRVDELFVHAIQDWPF